MARQAGTIKITGTIDDITFYKMGNEYYARMKSSLTGKKFWKHRAFAGSRRSARALGVASKLASLLYRTLPKEQKGRPVFQKLTGKIKFMLLDGLDAGAITIWFHKEYSGVINLEKVDEKPVEVKPIIYRAFKPSLPKFDKEISKLIDSFRKIETKEYLELVE